jgi:hypothetical protein
MRRNWCRQAFIFTSTDDPNVASFDVVLGKGGSGGGNALEEAFIFGTVVDAAERFYSDSWKSTIAQRYGAQPEILFYETPVIVDTRTRVPQQRRPELFGGSERDRFRRQAHGVIFTTDVTVQQWLPSQRGVKFDCIVVKQIPPCTIAASPERFLTPLLTPKGRNCGPGGNE